MYLDGGRLVVSPSDLVAHLLCAHVTELSLDVARGLRPPPHVDDPELSVVQARGMEHERAYLRALADEGAAVVEIDGGTFEEEVRETLAALARGPEVIYQAAFFDDEGDAAAWRGHADFLRRTDLPGTLSPYSYEPYDTKLARHVKPGAVIQLCAYAAQLTRLQGKHPERVHVVLGGDHVVTLRLADFAAYFRQAKRGFEAALAEGVESYPLPNSHCPVCPYHDECEERWRLDDHLVRVAGLTVEQARRLDAAGIATAGALADFDGDRVPRMAQATLDKLRHQARLQRTTAPDGRPAYELLETAGDGLGLGALPTPSAGDLFFDIEGDPFVGTGGIEYLLGVGWVEAGGSFSYRAFWGHDATGEKQSFEAFIDFVMARRAVHPDLHVFHFAPYETTAVGRLMGRYGTRESEVDQLLRSGVFVDLYRVVRQGVRVGTPSYSLKKLEALYLEDRRSGAIVDAGSSIVEYERWLQDADPAILQAIEEYNRTDCDSTRQLRDWLEARRGEYTERFGAEPPRPAPRDGAPTEGVEEEASAVAALVAALPLSAETDEHAAAGRLLADLLEWHRREEKPEWWKYYRRVEDFDETDLFEDTECIAGLEYLGTGENVRRSIVHRYHFDLTQEHKFREGDHPLDPDRERAKEGAGAGPGSIHLLDDGKGVLGLLRGEASNAAHPRALIPAGPIPTPEQRGALRRLAQSAIEHGIDGPRPYRAARDLLLRLPPRLTPTAAGPLVAETEGARDAAIQIAARLTGGCLGIQGPPGSGKTDAAGRIAVELLGAGRSVGITGQSHSVITNLLRCILEHAEKAGVEVRCSQRADGDQGLDHPAVKVRRTPNKVEEDLAGEYNLVAGTSWLFSRDSFDQSLEWLIVDEAGQLSLANTLAVATAARNLVLVGDPRQLAQPSKGTHPDGAGASALEHLLGDHDTMPETLGIFLDHTHRLHPDICKFVSEVVYEGRLATDDECARQRVGGSGPLSGAGIRWHPVDHAGNRISSLEEADAVAALHADLVGRTFTDRDGNMRKLGVEDVLVVAPYNAQVALLKGCLPSGARVGTVDKFQGLQAPAVIVSLTASSLAEIARGMEFLFSRNRLNVAVSRAQAMAIVVGSPRLLSVRCNTVEQLRLANGLCKLVELVQEC